MLEPLLLAVAVIAVMTGAVLQRITGIGFASAAGPALILLSGPVTGVQVLNALAAGCSLFALVSVWRQVEWRRTILLMASASAATPIGVLLAATLPESVLEIGVGLVMLAALSTVALIARWRPMRGPIGLLVAGALGGVANAAVGQAGPLMGAYAAASRWEFTRYVASMQACWSVVNLVALLLKGLPPIQPGVGTVLIASLLVGSFASLLIARVISRSTARRVLLVVALAGSAAVLVKGLTESGTGS